MAIYSLRLLPIGKTTQRRPFTAGAHIRYIMRRGAVTHHMAARMPDTSREAIRWLRAEERADRKNARVADKLVLALPRELDPDQRVELVRGFAETLTQGRASWFAAIHANGKDRDNPHCHLLVRDRDVATGERVVMFSAGAKEVKLRAHRGKSPPTTLKMIRELWARTANEALRCAGRSERIDHRRLVDQGDYRRAQVHEGPNVRAMHRRGARPVSKERVVRNPAIRRKGMPATRVVPYADIDQGLSRVEYNASLKEFPDLTLTEILALETRSGRARSSGRDDRGRGR
ncbi:MobA/MobL family protein [Hyphomicrobium sp.]|uniref:MobA/MobL family protein n=1 Tax=Hyphomicrobium sp. TaxID=82 RepID=UPI0025C2381D|nr:MobA/MobL family protein [Hyphomicrobium sp.]